MIGLEDQVEVGFMNALESQQREPAAFMLNRLPVVDLVDIFINGETPALKVAFSLTSEQWARVATAVMLTRLTQFAPNRVYPKAYLQFLRDYAYLGYQSWCQEEIPLNEVVTHAERNTPYFSRWFKQLLSLYRQAR